MIWATHLISLLALAASLPLSEAVDVKPVTLDVWAPKVLYPHNGTIWYTGQYHNVTWDNSKPPGDLTSPDNSMIYLVHNEQILFDYVLAQGFDLRLGRVEVQVPNVDTGSYQIDLFGDSGDWSECFTIQAQ